MNTFTRFISVIMLVFMAGFTHAQSYDLSVSAVATAANPSNQIPPDMIAPISMTIRNNGGNAIPSGTEFILYIFVNANYFVNPDTFVFNGDFTSGSEITLTSTAGYSFQASTPSYEICGGAILVDSASEANPANNEFCDDYLVSSAVNNDWAAMSVNIEEPSNLDGFDLDDNTNTVPDLDSIVLILQNNSNITFPRNYGVNYRLSLGGDTANVTGFLANVLGPGEQTTRIVASAAAFPVMVQDSGTWDFCVIAAEEGDNTDSNDVTCQTFTIIDSYDPFHPSNWPLGEEEVMEEQLTIVPMVDAVRIEGIEHTTEITVSDMQGRVVRTLNTTENIRIPLESEASGVYIIQATDKSNGSMEIKKFSKQ